MVQKSIRYERIYNEQYPFYPCPPGTQANSPEAFHITSFSYKLPEIIYTPTSKYSSPDPLCPNAHKR